MKTSYSANTFKSLAALVAAGSMILSATVALAQDNGASTQAPPPAPPPPAAVPAPHLAYGVSQILQMSQAKVNDDTIISYIRNSGNSYGLNADQIIYLQRQGVSSAVINAMLSQPPAGVVPTASQSSVPMPSGPAPAVDNSQAYYNTQPAQSAPVVGPSVTAVDPTAAAINASPYYYYSGYPYAYSYPYYYPAYGYGYYGYPAISVGFGWRGGWGWGPGWRGGWGGGWHGGGGWHR